MALDFAQVDKLGRVTGCTVRIDLNTHHSLIQRVSASRFPLLARMSDYYADASYPNEELEQLARELEEYKLTVSHPAYVTLLESALALVRDSAARGLVVEAIAD